MRGVGFMQRAQSIHIGRRGRLSGRYSGSSWDILASMRELDVGDYNSSLGSPLDSYDEATLAGVGGKALQCWRMMKYGFPVPEAFIVPTYVYSLHIEAAGVVELIDEVFTCDLRLERVRVREEMKPKLQKIREKIMETDVMEEVVENVENFINTVKNRNSSSTSKVSFAVRSSGSAEDLAGQSFAGQYDTYLYKSDLDDIITSIKGCWASMFKDHILEYAARPVFLQSQEDVYDPDNMMSPQMGVLIMLMIESDHCN